MLSVRPEPSPVCGRRCTDIRLERGAGLRALSLCDLGLLDRFTARTPACSLTRCHLCSPPIPAGARPALRWRVKSSVGELIGRSTAPACACMLASRGTWLQVLRRQRDRDPRLKLLNRARRAGGRQQQNMLTPSVPPLRRPLRAGTQHHACAAGGTWQHAGPSQHHAGDACYSFWCIFTSMCIAACFPPTPAAPLRLPRET